MPKVRLLVEQDVEDTIVDLQGFNNDPLVQNSNPYAFLCVKKINSKFIKNALEIFDLTQRDSSYGSVLVRKTKSENYKLDVLNLLGAALYLHQKDSNQKSYLGVAKSLLGLLSQADLVKKNIYMGEELEIDKFDYTSACLTLSQCAQLALHQSGVDVLTNTQNLTLDKIQVENLYSKFINSNKFTKVS